MSFRGAILLSADSKTALVVRTVFRHTQLQGDVLMKPEVIKKASKDTIQAMTDCSWFFSARPGKENTRNRKFPFQKVISSILAFGSGTLNHEIMDFFGLDPSAGTSSAFIQRRAAILPDAFECLFQHFTEKVDEDLRYFAVSESLPLTALIYRLQPIQVTWTPSTQALMGRKITICCISMLCMMYSSTFTWMHLFRKAGKLTNPEL